MDDALEETTPDCLCPPLPASQSLAELLHNNTAHLCNYEADQETPSSEGI